MNIDNNCIFSAIIVFPDIPAMCFTGGLEQAASFLLEAEGATLSPYSWRGFWHDALSPRSTCRKVQQAVATWKLPLETLWWIPT